MKPWHSLRARFFILEAYALYFTNKSFFLSSKLPAVNL